MEEKKPVKFDAHNIIHDAGDRVIYYYQTEIYRLTAENKKLLEGYEQLQAENTKMKEIIKRFLAIAEALKGGCWE